MLAPVDKCGACVIFRVIQCVTFQHGCKLLVSKMKSVVGEIMKKVLEGLFRHRLEQEAGLVPEDRGQELLEVGYLDWLMEQTVSWSWGLCWRRVMQGGLAHDCTPTLRQRVCGSGDTDQLCPTERVIRSQCGPAQRGMRRVLNENGRG